MRLLMRSFRWGTIGDTVKPVKKAAGPIFDRWFSFPAIRPASESAGGCSDAGGPGKKTESPDTAACDQGFARRYWTGHATSAPSSYAACSGQ